MSRDFKDIVPYTSVYIDASLSDFTTAVGKTVFGNRDRETIISEIQKIWTSEKNPNKVLPCLSVRSALDLFLRIKNFPPGSEIILSAINIPDMVRVVKHHQLNVVSLDVDMETCTPKHELLDHLVTEKTVAILVSHIYGKVFDMEPCIQFAAKHKLSVIEDCAEVFCGFEKIGHPKSDISLFSFGPIKFITSFGGAVAKIASDDVFDKMERLYRTYPHQAHTDYLKRIFKCLFAYTLLDCPKVTKSLTYACVVLGVDHKKHVVSMLRGFPHNLIPRIRAQPSTALLSVMLHRMRGFHAGEIVMTNAKGDYVTERLDDKVTVVGSKAKIRNYWLYPIIVENPDQVFKALNALGVDAYRGATQLSIVEPDPPVPNHLQTFITHYPHEAKFIIDHVIYLPVNKSVPFEELDRIISAVEVALKATNGDQHLHLARKRFSKLASKL